MELYLKRTIHGLGPDDQISNECLEKYKLGDRIKCVITKPHNSKFHRKLMALFNVGYKYWVPGEITSKYGTPQKNFDRFRKDVTIMAGYYDIDIRFDGSTRISAKSISYKGMTEDDKESLYSKVIDVLLANIFKGYSREDVVDMAAKEILGFA